MSTAPDQRIRNAEEGVKLAQRAMELDGNNDPRYVETLAAAYANGGQFEAAAELLKHALETAKGEAAGRIQAQLTVYKEGKPFRDGPEPQSAAKPSIPARPVQTKQR
jgi:thioredoxin-like negative regulator of GroEL